MSRSLLSVSLLLSLLLAASAHGGDHGDADSGVHSGGPNLRARPLVLVKVWCLVLVFAGTFLAGVSPYFLKWNEGLLVLGTQFAGGVFLGTALMHFLSDSAETFGDLTEKAYPFAYMLASVGYLVTMLADCVVSYVYGKEQSNGSASTHVGDLGVRGPSELEKAGQNGDASTHHAMAGLPAQSLSSATSFGDSILLILALCFHSVFEGIAIGVAETEADAWRVLWTVSLHKLFAAIAMGIALLRMIPNRPLLSCAAYAFAFAISSPVGVAIGIIIDATTQGGVANWIYAISMGLACGVFIYVSINHLLSKGYTPKKRVPVDTSHHKFFAVLLGVGVIAVVMIWDT